MTKTPKPSSDIAYYDDGGVRYRGFQFDGEWEFLRRDEMHGTFDRAGRVVKETEFPA
jgi:hypothetical protein